MKKRHAIGAAISVAIFAVLNAIEPRVSFWYDGGFVGHRGLLWGGLLADVLVVLAGAMFCAYLIGWYERRP